MGIVIRIFACLAAILASGTVISRAQDSGLLIQIRAQIHEINQNLPSCTRQSKVVLGLSTEGANVDYFHDSEKLRKIAAQIYGETFNSEAEFYYRDGALLFAYEKFNRYDSQIGAEPPPKVVSSQVQRLYFDAAGLAALRIGEEDLSRGDARWRDTERRMVELSKDLQAAFRRD